MAVDSKLKKFNIALEKTFTMNSNKTIDTDFSSSALDDDDYFYLYVAHGSYDCSEYYFVIDSYDNGEHEVYRYDTSLDRFDKKGWPHSNPYTPGKICQQQFYIPEKGKYKIFVEVKAAFGYNGSSSDPRNSWYNYRIDLDDEKIKYSGWVNGYNQPFYGSMWSKGAWPNPIDDYTRWLDFGTYTKTLTKGIHTILVRMGAAHIYNKHAAIAVNNMRLTLTKL